MPNPHPTDADILACIRPGPAAEMGDPTYLVRNRLAAPAPYGFGLAVKTPAVLRRLKRLERDGKVERARSAYAVMIAWRRTEEVRADV